MKISPTGIAVIQAFESCLKPIGGGMFHAYRCPALVLTIGWGTTRDDYPSLTPDDVWSQEKCDEVFAASLGKYEAAVTRALGARQLAQHQFDAMVSFVYNVGPGGLGGRVGDEVRASHDAAVPSALAMWVRGGGKVLPGLVRRRKSEGLLYAGQIDEALKVAGATVPGSMPQSRAPEDTPDEPSVSDLQIDLNYLGEHLKVDGSFGPATKAAVMRFQSSHGLFVDGIPGHLTWTALAAALKRKG